MNALAAFQVLVLTMAAAMAVEALKPSYSTKWRAVFWVLFVILAIGGIATNQIAAAWPAASAFMAWAGSGPVPLFLAFLAWVLWLQKPWRRVSASPPNDRLPAHESFPDDAMLVERIEAAISRHLGELQRETVAETFKASDRRAASMAEHFEKQVAKLDSKIETIGKLALEHNKLQGERNDLIQKQLDQASGTVAAVQHMLGELQQTQIEGDKDYRSFKRLVEQALENTWRKIDRRSDWIDQGFAAILDRERLLSLAASIEAVADELSGPTRGEPLIDRDKWLAQFGGWMGDVETWTRIAEIYRADVIKKVHDTPQHAYRGDWAEPDSLFPDGSIAVHDYKTFRIVLNNFRDEREPVERCVQRAAFVRPSMKGRSEIERDEEAFPLPDFSEDARQ